MKRLIVLTAALFSFAACQSTKGAGCPPLKEYPLDLQKRAAREIRAGHAPTLSKLTTDYGQLRDACRLGDR